MAQSQEERVEAQICALVDIFIEGLTSKEALELLGRGPSALASNCFRWAFDAADLVERETRMDTVSAVGLFERAPIVARLRELAHGAFVDRYGEPEIPRLPERPEGLGAGVVLTLEEEQHRRMSGSARSLVRTAIYSPGMSSQSCFYITTTRDRSEWILWIKWEDSESYRHFTTVAAWIPRSREVSEHDAALFLLEDYWSAMRDEWEETRPNELEAYGHTITQDELEVLGERVWPED